MLISPRSAPSALWWLVTVVVVVLGVWFLARHRGARAQDIMAKRLEVDARDPYKRWVQGVFLVVTGNCDYAHLPRAEAVRILAQWWEVHGPLEHSKVLTTLVHSNRPDNAWDLVRFVLVARLGVAAGYLDDAGAWQAIRPVCQRLQRAYPDWVTMAQGYLLARRQDRSLALDGSEDDGSTSAVRDNIAHLREGLWRETPFDLDLD